jgi:hypothetical protein
MLSELNQVCKVELNECLCPVGGLFLQVSGSKIFQYYQGEVDSAERTSLMLITFMENV